MPRWVSFFRLFLVAVCFHLNSGAAIARPKPKLPDPETAWLEKHVTITAKDASLGDTLSDVLRDAPLHGSGFAFDPDQKITVTVKNRTVREALDLVLHAANPKYAWRWDRETRYLNFGYTPAVEAEQAMAEKKQREDDLVFLAKLATDLNDADSVMIFLLDFSHGEVAEAMFPVRPEGSYTKILNSKTFAAKDVQPLLEALRALLSEKDDRAGGALCHFPVHGIRVFTKPHPLFGVRLLFESSFCWECHNYYVTLPRPGFGECSTFRGIPPNSKMEAEFQKLLPIPQSELDRFKAMGGK